MRQPRRVAVGLAIALLSLVGASCGDEPRAEQAGLRTARAAVVTSTCATVGSYPVCAHFAAPAARGVTDDGTIINELIRLIHGAPAGSEIRGTIYSFSIDAVYDELASARARGVNLRVVEDGAQKGEYDPERLAALLGGNHVFCKNGGGLGCATYSPGGIQHSKYFLFSQTLYVDNVTPKSFVTWIGSANLSATTGLRAHNDSLTFYGAQTLYSGMVTHFENEFSQGQPWCMSSGDNDYHCPEKGRGEISATGINSTVYLSPETGGADLLEQRLDDYKTTAGSECVIRVAHQSFGYDRRSVADTLVAYKNRGCSVAVAIGGGGMDTSYVLPRLKSAGISVKQWSGVGGLHSKMISLKAKDSAGTVHYMVYTGSHNLTGPANSQNDEVLVKLESPELYTNYYNHFQDYWGLSTWTAL